MRLILTEDEAVAAVDALGDYIDACIETARNPDSACSNEERCGASDALIELLTGKEVTR